MKKIFSFRLYVEGLKRVRLLGFAAGIVIIFLMCITPLAEAINGVSAECLGTNLNNLEDFANFLVLLPVFAILLISQMFSFLDKRKASDFYHSIPYNRTCVLFSFLTAAYTWILGVLAISLGLSAFLWHLTAANVNWVLFPIVFALFSVLALFVGGFVLLAKTVTGTTFAGGMLALVLMALFRVLGAIVANYMQTLVPFADLGYTALNIFSAKTSVILMAYEAYGDYTLLSSPLMWIYTAIVILICHGAAIFFYHKRKSELAEKNSAGRVIQHFYSLAFSLPFALYAVIALLAKDSDSVGECIIAAVISASVFYLSELISYKKISAAFKATPLLLIIAGICGIFAGGSYLYEKHVRETAFAPEEISAIRFYDKADILDTKSQTFHYALKQVITVPSYVSNNFEFQDREIIQLISDAWATTLESDPKAETLHAYHFIAFEAEDGDVAGRRVGFTMAQYLRLKVLMLESADYAKGIGKLPEKDTIDALTVFGAGDQTGSPEAIWESFSTEFNALSLGAKRSYILEMTSEAHSYAHHLDSKYVYENGPLLSLELKMGKRKFTEYFVIDERFPQTRKLLIEMVMESTKPKISEALEPLSATRDEIISSLKDYNSTFTFQIRYKDVYAELELNFEEFDYKSDAYNKNAQEKLDLLLELVSNANKNPEPTNNQCMFRYSMRSETLPVKAGTIPLWLDEVDGALFERIIRLANCEEMNKSSLRGYLYNSYPEPMQMVLFFPDDRRYSLCVENSFYHGVFWDKAKQVFPLLKETIGSNSNGHEETVDIYLTRGSSMFFATFECEEFPEEILETFDSFS